MAMTVCRNCERHNRDDATYCDACGGVLASASEADARAGAAGAAGEPPFVGRSHDLTQLRASLDKAGEGRGRVVGLAGEPGIGKTRTAQAFAEEATHLGFNVLWGRCHEEPGAPPYWPWVQALREYVGACAPETLRSTFGPVASELAEVLPQLAEVLPFAPCTPLPEDGAQARFRFFDAVLTSWKRAAAQQPLLLVLDNMHWADTPSLRLLEFLTPEIGACRILVLITYRDIALSRRHPLSNTLSELAKQPGFLRVRLRGFNAAETAQFMKVITGAPPADDLLAVIHGQTEGNPLFVREMTRFLLDEGLLDAQAAGFHLRNPARPLHRIPEGIREAIGARLNRLSAACNRVLAHAAVIGRSFHYTVLRSVVENMDEETLRTAFDEAISAAVVERLAGRDTYQFSHALIREALYEELTTGQRMRIHLRVADAIEMSSAVMDWAALAHHRCAALPAGDVKKARDSAQRAGAQADRLCAYEEAARYYRLARQALETEGHAQGDAYLLLLIEEGETLNRSANWREAREIFGEAAALAKALRLPHELARAARGFEEATWRPGLSGEAAANLLREALDALGEAESLAKAEVLSALTRALIFTGDVDEAMRISEHAIAMARRLGEPAALANALRAGLGARWLPEHLDRRMATAAEAMELARAAGDRQRVLEAASWRLFDLMELGNLQARAAVFEAYAREADELRQPFYQYIAISSRSMLALFEGHLSTAEEWAQRALAFGARMPGLDAAGIYGVQMFSIRREQGRLKELQPLVAHFVRTTPQAARWRPGLALVFSELGLREEARAEFESLAGSGFAAVPRDGLWASSIAYLAEVCAFLEDGERAGELYAYLAPYEGRNVVAGPNIACAGAVTRHLGLLAMVMERWTDAERHFQAALEMNARQGARPWLAHTQFQFGAMLLLQGRSADRERALDLIEAAAASALEMGMQALVERSEALREKKAPAHKRYPAGLSRREVEVLRLIAAGKANREIADRLYVSPNTVANHVRSILTKTHTANRTEAAAFALRNALVEAEPR